MQIIRNIWCVGRNFKEHARELGNPIPSEPLFFLKAGSCLVPYGEPLRLPPFSQEVEAELELALQFNASLQVDRACLALDLTARDLQTRAKKEGLPWTLAKSFAGACPISPFFPLSSLNEPLTFSLSLNGRPRQQGDTRSMLFSLRDLIAYAKSHFPLCPGDLLLTGTPAGAPPIAPGDRLEGYWQEDLKAQWLVIQ